MLTNRSAPHARVVPILMVANARAAVTWCARVFGFVEHVQTPDGKHVQLGLPGGGELLVGQVRPRPNPSEAPPAILIKVDDAAATLARAIDNYAMADFGLQDGEGGERHAMFEDPFGHSWAIVQSGQPSVARARVVPAVHVANVSDAVEWYTRVFGFVGQPMKPYQGRADLSLGDGELLVGEIRPLPKVPIGARSPEILLKVEDTESIVATAAKNGATILESRDIAAGERQATVDDVFGHRWLLTQTLVDTAPEQWGGKTLTPRP